MPLLHSTTVEDNDSHFDDDDPPLDQAHAPLEFSLRPSTESTFAQGQELNELKNSSLKIQGLLAAAPAFEDNTATAIGGVPHQIEPSLIIDNVTRSVDGLVSVLSFIELVNDVGRATPSRSIEAGRELIPVVAENIHQRAKNSGVISPGEQRLLNLYIKSVGSKNIRPEWYVVAKHALQVTGRSPELPGPEVYIQYSEAARDKAAKYVSALTLLTDEIFRMRNSPDRLEGPGGEKTLEAIKKREEILQLLDRRLLEAGDVDPRKVDKCCKSVAFQVLPKPQMVDALVGLFNSLGKTIEALALRTIQRDESPPIPCAQFLGVPAKDNAAVTVITRLARYNLDSRPLLSHEPQTETLAWALKEYVRVQQALLRAYALWQSYGDRSDASTREVSTCLERELGAVFLSNPDKTRAIFIALGQNDDPVIQSLLPSLLTTKVIEDGRIGIGTSASFLEKKENIQLLGHVLSHLVHGDETTASMIEAALKNGALRSVCEFGLRVRGRLKEKDVVGLARLFDDRLLAGHKERLVSFADKAATLHVLTLASEEDAVRRGLKGRLKNLELVDQLASALHKDIVSDHSAPAQFIETLRARIVRTFSSDLSDYWGQRDLVNNWKKLLDNHLEMLRSPEAWMGLAPDRVFYNGYLLFGDFGAGKSFLVTCMANQLQLPLVTISREEMSKAFMRAESEQGANAKTDRTKEDLVETTLARFIEDKISRAQLEMRKTGAVACMLFLDEMEAEFQKRDPRTSPREEIARTNIMLRVIEKLIKKHPDIVFVGATNHIEQVDGAALRPGRFGIHLEVKMPERDDVMEILSGAFEVLGLELSSEIKKSEQYNNLVNNCVGFTPLDIQLAINSVATLHRVRTHEKQVVITNDLIGIFDAQVSAMKQLHYKPPKRENT